MSDSEIRGDFLLRLGLSSVEDLKVEISPHFYDEVAECLSDWKCVALKKGVGTDDIEIDCPKRKDQAIQFLKTWKSMESFNVTYKELVQTLFRAKLVNDARKVCEVFKSKLNYCLYFTL